MKLNVQINLLVFSFFFGFVFSILLNINYKFIYNSNKFIKFISSFLLILGAVLSYFIGIKKINNAILHPYSGLMIIIGFLLDTILFKFIANKLKK